MAKASGLGYSVTVQDSTPTNRVLSNDITDFNYALPRAVQDITGVDKFAFERLLLLADFSLQMNGVFNNAANQSHDVFKTISSTSVNRNVILALTVNAVTSTLTNACVLTDYQLKRAQGGAFTWTVPAALADGTVPTWT